MSAKQPSNEKPAGAARDRTTDPLVRQLAASSAENLPEKHYSLPTVVKVGGSIGIDYDAVCADVARIVESGTRLILVHGGSSQTNQVATALGHPPTFITSPSGYTSRLTDQRTLEIFKMVYCGQMNKMIVEKLQALGVNALGLSGIDGGLWRGPRKKVVHAVDENGKKRVVRDNFTGCVERVNVALLNSLLDAGYLPVLTPPAISDEGEAINVDGDRAAAETAKALAARALVILSNVPGVLADFPDEASLIREIDFADLESVADRCAQGRMRIKMLAAGEAITGGVGRVILGDARVANPNQNALDGNATVICGNRTCGKLVAAEAASRQGKRVSV